MLIAIDKMENIFLRRLTSMGYLSGMWEDETPAALSIIRTRIDLQQR